MKVLGIVFATTLIDMIGFGLVIPILPFFAKDLGASPVEIGLLTSSYLAMQFLASPMWGRASDRWGRRPILIVCLFAGAAAYAAFAFSTTIGMILGARIVGGVFAGKFSTLQAIVADVTSAKDRAKGMGVFGAAFGLGFIIGPVVGGVLGKDGYALPLLTASGLSIVSGLAALVWLKETRSPEERDRQDPPGLWVFVRRLSWKDPIGVAFQVYFLFNFCFSILWVTFALYLEKEFDYHTRETGYFFGLMGIVGVVLQGGLTGYLTRRWREKKLILWGIVAMSGGFLCLVFLGHVAGVVVACVLIAVGSGLMSPSLTAVVSNGTAEQDQGTVMGYLQSSATLARMGGMMTGGVFFVPSLPVLPFVIATGTLTLTWFSARRGLSDSAPH